jgi:hypothetical protein
MNTKKGQFEPARVRKLNEKHFISDTSEKKSRGFAVRTKLFSYRLTFTGKSVLKKSTKLNNFV